MSGGAYDCSPIPINSNEGTSRIAGRAIARVHLGAKPCDKLNFLIRVFALQNRGNARVSVDRTDYKLVLVRGTHCPLTFQFRAYIFMYLGYLFFNIGVVAKHEISIELNFP